jgi:O-antigen ligase
MLFSANMHLPFFLIGLGIYILLLFTSMAGMSIGMSLFFFFFCGGLFFYKKNLQKHLLNTPQKKAYFLATTALIFVCFVSLFFAWLYPPTYAQQSFRIQPADFFKAQYFFLPLLTSFALSAFTRLHQKKILQFWLFCSFLISLFGIAQIFFGFNGASINPSMHFLYQTTLLLHHHLSTASILIFPFFVSLSLALSEKKAPYFLCAGLSLITLFFTWSRTLWVALPIGMAINSLRFFSKKTLFSLSLISSAFLLWLFTIPAVYVRLTHPTGSTDRWYLWKANWAFFQSHPLFGIGWRKPEFLTAAYFQETYPDIASSLFIGHAHSMILENLGSIGLIGTLVWIYWCAFILRLAYQKSHQQDNFKKQICWGVFCAWIVFFLNGLTQVNFWESRCLHHAMWSIALLFI